MPMPRCMHKNRQSGVVWILNDGGLLMRTWYFLLSIMSALLLSACQTTSLPRGFSAVQIAELRQQGFVESDDGWELSMADRLLFATDSAALQPEMVHSLERIAGGLMRVGIRSARIEGHTDSTGTLAYNLSLSRNRAQVVGDALSARGFAVAVHGRGETRPIADNSTEQGRQLNRRVVIIVSPE
jgi:outer membrane protein OmpA-like peptidoglycan-associated protein